LEWLYVLTAHAQPGKWKQLEIDSKTGDGVTKITTNAPSLDHRQCDKMPSWDIHVCRWVYSFI